MQQKYTEGQDLEDKNKGRRLASPFCVLAAAAAVIPTVAVVAVVAAAAAYVAEQEHQDDDPPPVVAAEQTADIVVTAHKKYLLNGIWVGFLTHTILFRGGENVLTGLA
jgi:uncharacterized membrane protein